MTLDDKRYADECAEIEAQLARERAAYSPAHVPEHLKPYNERIGTIEQMLVDAEAADKIPDYSPGMTLRTRQFCAMAAEVRRLRGDLQRFLEREPLVQELLEAADFLGDELYPILVDHDYNMRQNFRAAAKVRDFKVTP